MTNIKMLFILLPLFVMACTLTTQNAAMTLPIARRTNPTTSAPTQNVLHQCQVKTGIEAGTLNLRTCGGTYCPTATILHEGETLTQTDPEAVDGWIPIRNSDGLQGWANSKYLICESK